MSLIDPPGTSSIDLCFLLQELTGLGLPSPCAPGGEGEGSNLDVLSLVNTAFELVQNYKRCAKTIADMEAQSQRVQCDLEQARSGEQTN